MAEFATEAQMDARTQGAITAATYPYLPTELLAAERLIRDACGWHVAPVKVLTARRLGAAAARLWLPVMGDVEVLTATVDGVTLDPATVEVDPTTGLTNVVGWSWAVEYRAGLEAVPEPLTSLALQVAARALGAPLGLVREQAGAVSVSHTAVAPGAAGGAVLLAHELAQLEPYRIGYLP